MWATSGSTPRTSICIGRFGAGASREFGGVDDEWAAEALFGLDYEYLISDKQRFTMKVDYFPEWEDFGQYRVVSDAGLGDRSR